MQREGKISVKGKIIKLKSDFWKQRVIHECSIQFHINKICRLSARINVAAIRPFQWKV